MTQFGMYSTMTPRNDASPARGQWNLDNAYRYLSEAYGGYHCDALNGINLEAGIFMSYVGLFSYYNFDNWTYQPSYVSSNTPWFFNGVRVQIFPTDKLKIEPWLINGWQSYGKFNSKPGRRRADPVAPERLRLDPLATSTASARTRSGNPDRMRFHTDDSIEVKYYDQPEQRSSTRRRSRSPSTPAARAAAASSCAERHSPARRRSTSSASWPTTASGSTSDQFGLTVGGGAINNPGRYLVLLPPINGATALLRHALLHREPRRPVPAPGTRSVTFDYMPSQFITFRAEFNHRAANVPYFSGPGGVTPPGGNTGPPARWCRTSRPICARPRTASPRRAGEVLTLPRSAAGRLIGRATTAGGERNRGLR